MAALIAPLFIDWTGYRANFEAEASKILGRPVVVAGAASARLLPFPSVAFEDVRVGEDPDKPTLSIARFSMDAELAPFLSGEVLIFDMRVTRPQGQITIAADGTTDWALRSQSPFNAGQVRIENLVIDGGKIDIVDERAARTHRLAIVDAQLSARALTGPWRLNGSVAFDGEPLDVSLSSGSVSPEGTLPLSVTVTPTQRFFVVEGDGTAKAVEGRLTWDGGFLLRQAGLTDKTAPALRDGAGVLAGGEGPSSPWRATGKFAFSATGLELPQIRLETGARENPYVANGKGSLLFGAVPMFDLALDGAQVTFAESDANAPVAADRIAAIKDTLNAVPMPEIPGTVTINLPAVVAGDTTIRDIAFTASPENNTWRVRDFRAELPGRTRVEADGALKTGDDFSFAGKLLVASKQPAGFSNWLTGTVDPAIRNLEALGLSADVALSSEVQTFDKLELAIGTSIFLGNAERRTDGARPSISASLSGGELPLSALSALSAGLFSQGGGNRLSDHDISLSLDAGPVTQDRLEAQSLGLSVRLKADRIDIDRLMITGLEGASISATGQVEELGTTPKASVDVSLVSEDGAPFFEAMASRLAPNSAFGRAIQNIAAVPSLLVDFQSTVVGTLNEQDGLQSASFSYTARTAGGEQALTGSWTGEAENMKNGTISLNGTVRDNEPVKLLAAFGLPVLPLGIPGPVDLVLTGDGSLVTGLTVSADWKAAGTGIAWKGTVAEGAAGLTADGDLSIKSGDFDPYLQATGIVLAGSGGGSPVNLTAQTGTNGAITELGGLDLTVAGAQLKGDVSVDFAAVRPKISGVVATQTLDVLWLLETLYGPDATGLTQTAFAQTPYIPADVSVALSGSTLDMGPIGTASDFKANFVSDAAAIGLNSISATLAGGALAGAVEARNDGGNGVVRGDFSLKGAAIGSLTHTRGLGGVVDVSSTFAGSAKSMNGMVSALTGSGVVTLNGAVFPGLNPNGFGAIGERALNGTEVPTTDEVDGLLAQSVRIGAFPLGADAMAWSLGGGVARVPSIRAETGGATLEATLEADLANWTASVSGAMTYVAGKAAVAGAEPQVPFQVSLNAGETALFTTDPAPLTQYLTQASLEREQARVEAMQAGLIEKQRLRREVRRVSLLYVERDRRSSALENAVRLEAARKAAVFVDQWKAELARREAEAKAKREAEDAAALKAAEDAAAQLKNATPVPPSGQTLQDVFKSLDFNVAP